MDGHYLACSSQVQCVVLSGQYSATTGRMEGVVNRIKTGEFGPIAWTIYSKNSVGLTVKPTPNLTRLELFDIIQKLTGVLNTMSGMDA